MATRRYGLNAGQVLEQLTEAVGAPTVANNIELTVDLSSAIVTDGGTTRAITKNEVLLAMEIMGQYIMRSNWPPA